MSVIYQTYCKLHNDECKNKSFLKEHDCTDKRCGMIKLEGDMRSWYGCVHIADAPKHKFMCYKCGHQFKSELDYNNKACPECAGNCSRVSY